MRGLKRWLFLAAVLAAAAVTVSSLAQAAWSGEWGPVLSVGWIPAAVIAVWPWSGRRCLSRQGRQPDVRR